MVHACTCTGFACAVLACTASTAAGQVGTIIGNTIQNKGQLADATLRRRMYALWIYHRSLSR